MNSPAAETENGRAADGVGRHATALLVDIPELAERREATGRKDRAIEAIVKLRRWLKRFSAESNKNGVDFVQDGPVLRKRCPTAAASTGSS